MTRTVFMIISLFCYCTFRDLAGEPFSNDSGSGPGNNSRTALTEPQGTGKTLFVETSEHNEDVMDLKQFLGIFFVRAFYRARQVAPHFSPGAKADLASAKGSQLDGEAALVPPAAAAAAGDSPTATRVKRHGVPDYPQKAPHRRIIKIVYPEAATSRSFAKDNDTRSFVKHGAESATAAESSELSPASKAGIVVGGAMLLLVGVVLAVQGASNLAERQISKKRYPYPIIVTSSQRASPSEPRKSVTFFEPQQEQEVNQDSAVPVAHRSEDRMSISSVRSQRV